MTRRKLPRAGERIVDVQHRRTHAAPELRPADVRASERAAADIAKFGLTVRDKHEGDIPKITSDWIRSYKDAPAMRGIGGDIYAANQHELIAALWHAPMAVWLVATMPSFPTFIAGWLCGEVSERGPIVHYVYVRHSFTDGDGVKVPARRIGIARSLFDTFVAGLPDSSRVWYTHETAESRRVLMGNMAPQPGAPGWEYNPWLAWRFGA